MYLPCHALYGVTQTLGHDGLDMVAVIHALSECGALVADKTQPGR